MPCRSTIAAAMFLMASLCAAMPMPRERRHQIGPPEDPWTHYLRGHIHRNCEGGVINAYHWITALACIGM